MPEEPLRTLVEGLHARLHEELDVQLREMADSHAREVERARQAAHDEAQRRWTAQLEAARLEWNTRLQAEVSNVRSESERALIAETMRARVQAEQAAAESTSIARRELEDSFAAERRRLEEQLEAERKRVTDASAERDRLAEALDAARRRTADAETERQRLSAAVETERVKALTELEAERGRAQAGFDGEREQLRAGLETEREKLRKELDGEREQLRVGLEAEREKLRKDLDVERESLAADGETHRLRIVELEAGHAQQAAEIATGRERVSELKLEVDRIAGDLELARLPRESVAADLPTAAALGEALPDATASHVSRLSEALGALDAAPDLTTLLAATVRVAAAEAPRAALFVVAGGELCEWPVDGVASMDPGRLRVDGREAGVMAEALGRREPVATNGGNGPSAPFFATLPQDAQALAVPLMLGGTPVAVLYADQGTAGPSSAAAACWADAVRIVGRHAAVCAATLTAVRTAQVMRHLSAGVPDAPPPSLHPDSRGNSLPGFVAGSASS